MNQSNAIIIFCFLMVILNSFSYLSDKTNLDTIPIITFFLTFFIALIFEKKNITIKN
ncbi:hypothetical protein GCM10025860_21580 [Methanobacterium ferruginis]|nr:hypothetical protein GCM10025860_21580 [Methanobacterium ferruginis]